MPLNLYFALLLLAARVIVLLLKVLQHLVLSNLCAPVQSQGDHCQSSLQKHMLLVCQVTLLLLLAGWRNLFPGRCTPLS
jgi:hypothetical protein